MLSVCGIHGFLIVVFPFLQLKMNSTKPAVKIEKKNPLEVLKAAGYSEHENDAVNIIYSFFF